MISLSALIKCNDIYILRYVIMKKMRFGSNYSKSSVKVKIWLPEILLVQNNKLKVIKEELKSKTVFQN